MSVLSQTTLKLSVTSVNIEISDCKVLLLYILGSKDPKKDLNENTGLVPETPNFQSLPIKTKLQLLIS